MAASQWPLLSGEGPRLRLAHEKGSDANWRSHPIVGNLPPDTAIRKGARLHFASCSENNDDLIGRVCFFNQTTP